MMHTPAAAITRRYLKRLLSTVCFSIINASPTIVAGVLATPKMIAIHPTGATKRL